MNHYFFIKQGAVNIRVDVRTMYFVASMSPQIRLLSTESDHSPRASARINDRNNKQPTSTSTAWIPNNKRKEKPASNTRTTLTLLPARLPLHLDHKALHFLFSPSKHSKPKFREAHSISKDTKTPFNFQREWNRASLGISIEDGSKLLGSGPIPCPSRPLTTTVPFADCTHRHCPLLSP